MSFTLQTDRTRLMVTELVANIERARQAGNTTSMLALMEGMYYVFRRKLTIHPQITLVVVNEMERTRVSRMVMEIAKRAPPEAEAVAVTLRTLFTMTDEKMAGTSPQPMIFDASAVGEILRQVESAFKEIVNSNEDLKGYIENSNIVRRNHEATIEALTERAENAERNVKKLEEDYKELEAEKDEEIDRLQSRLDEQGEELEREYTREGREVAKSVRMGEPDKDDS